MVVDNFEGVGESNLENGKSAECDTTEDQRKEEVLKGGVLPMYEMMREGDGSKPKNGAIERVAFGG